MAVLGIVHYGNPILRKPCSPVIDFSQMDTLLEDMFDSMYEAEGIGLAANQVGLDMNLFIIDITHTEETEELHVFINSKIVATHGDEEVILKYQTPDEQWHENEFGGLLSRAIQHELDHLNGVFIVDRVGEVERIQYQAELKALEKNSKKFMKSRSGKKGFVL